MNLSATTTTTGDPADAQLDARGFWPLWRWWLAPAFVALVLILLYVDPFIGDWDGLEYTVQAVRGEPSSMLLGRIFFLYFLNGLWRIAHFLFQLPPEKAYLLFKYVVVAQGPLAVIAGWKLARDLTHSVHTATLAAVLMALSPVLIVYSGQVMTDVPSVLLVTLALIIHLKGLRERRFWFVIAGAALLGAAVNVRETVSLFAPWLVIAPFVCGWKIRGRELMLTLVSCLVFLFLALVPFAMLFALNPRNYRHDWFVWRDSLKVEAARHPIVLANLRPFLTFLFAMSPLTVVALPVAAYKEWRNRGFTPLLTLALLGVFVNFVLFFNYAAVINWRYFVTGLPAFAPLAADFFMQSQTKRFGTRQRGFVSAIASVVLIAIICGIYLKPVSYDYVQKRTETMNYRRQLSMIPNGSVVLAGTQTIAVLYWRGIGYGNWLAIGTGAGWPEDNLIPTIDNYLKEGKRVFLDANPKWWSPCGWQKNETSALFTLESHFRFRHVAESIYEIRPADDMTANDNPGLKNLLPENRPEETTTCRPLNRNVEGEPTTKSN